MSGARMLLQNVQLGSLGEGYVANQTKDLSTAC